MKVRYSYLKQQFSNCEDLWTKLKNLFVLELYFGQRAKNF